MLPGRPPQVTFACDTPTETCNFQFWIGQKESFYCALDQCATELKHGFESNSTFAECAKIKCKCIPGRMMCGEEGSVGSYAQAMRFVMSQQLLSFFLYVQTSVNFSQKRSRAPRLLIAPQAKDVSLGSRR